MSQELASQGNGLGGGGDIWNCRLREESPSLPGI
jgi:hypothetical protein